MDLLNYKDINIFKVENNIPVSQMLETGMYFATIVITFDKISIAYVIDLKSLEKIKEIDELVN